MPRRGRVIAPRCPHHVVQRGHNREAVFFTEDDRSSYLATLREFREKLGVQFYASCLIPIESSTYLLACARYVDLNPVRAHMVDRPENYAWSGYRARIGLSDCSWIDPDPSFLALASTTEQRQQRYREFVARGIPNNQLQFLHTAVQRNQLTGSDAFILEIEQLTGTRVLNRPPGRPARDDRGVRKK